MKTTYTEKDLNKVAETVVSSVGSKTLCFYGEMGAGKTTLIKAIIKYLGAVDIGNSPTFGIVNEYESAEGELLAYHFDFYRLNDENEALDLGLEDYLNSDAWIFVEWPEKISSLLPDDVTNIYLETIDEQTREILLK